MAESIALKDSFRETRIFQMRLVFLGITIIAMTLILVARYFNLQILQYESFATRSDANRILTQIIPPVRGLIKDQSGKLLADSRPSFSLNIVRERSDNIDLTIKKLQSLIDISNEQVNQFHKRSNKRGHRPFQSVPLRYRLSDEEIATIAVNEWRLPGVEIAAQLVRNYPYGEHTAHNLGYVGSINEQDVSRLSESGKWKNYEGVVYSIGKLGIEKVYEDILFGVGGTRKVEVNAKGQVLREIDKWPPQSGKNLTLFLDIDLQKTAAESLSGQRGAVVALETQTGGIVTAISTPSFDPNLFVTGISNKDYSDLRDDWKLPLFNRILQGQYPPGSTTKPLVGLTGLEESVITPQYSIDDPGYFQLPNDERLYRDWKRSGHGKKITLRKAIEQSCDTYFYSLGVNLGIDRISPFMKKFGLGEKTGVDLTYERRGILPSREWKQKRDGRPWFPGDTVNISIGQGDMLATPMQLAYMTAILANRGKRLVPRMVKMIDNQATEPEMLSPIVLNNVENWGHVIDGMVDVVHHSTGTAAHLSKNMTYTMAGKTGTAQVVGIKQDEKYDRETIALRNRDHALFIAFAPVDKPQIAVAVIVENGESGSRTAAPIAKAVIDGYLAKFPPQQAPGGVGKDAP